MQNPCMLPLEVYFYLIPTHSYQRIFTRTHFETDALGGSDISHCITAFLGKSVCQVVGNKGSRSHC